MKDYIIYLHQDLSDRRNQDFFGIDKDGNVTTIPNDKAGYYDLGPTDLGENVRGDIVSTLQQMGFDIEASHHEVADGQHEIDFKYADILAKINFYG